MDAATVSAVANSLTALAAAGAAVVAAKGLATWREQLTGRTHYDLARRMLKNTYRLRERFKAARSPLILAGEFETAIEDEGLERGEEDRFPDYDEEAHRAVYDRRWQAVADARADLEADALEAEALWGPEETDAALQPLRDCIGELFAIMNEHVMRLDPAPGHDDQRRLEIQRRLWGRGDEDELGDQLDEAIGDVEGFLRSHLDL